MSKPLKNALIIAVGLVVMLGVGYSSRGWIRGQFIPNFSRHIYKGKVDHTFDTTYKPVNAYLENLGIAFSNKPSTLTDECNKINEGDGGVAFKGISESVSCYKTLESNNITPNPSFVSIWKQRAPAFEHYLLLNGWQISNFGADSEQATISKLFDQPAVQGSSRVDYDKKLGKIDCNFTLYYNHNPYSAMPNTFNVSENCSRSINFFGGYDPYSQ